MRKREYQRRKERKVWRTWKEQCEMNVPNQGFDRECWDLYESIQEHRKWKWLHLDKHGAIDIVASEPWVFGAQQDKLRPSKKKNHCCYVSLFLLDILSVFHQKWEAQGHFQCMNLARAVLWIVWSEKKKGEKGEEKKFQPVFKAEHVPGRWKC